MTALGTASGQNSTATTGTRANEETVSALAADDGRLVSTFHVGDSPEFIKGGRGRGKTRD